MDRLVIMVTHNPDLADKYANRIITMKDGLLTGDTNLYKGETPEERKEVLSKRTINKGSKEKTSMSFFTAMGLSLSNLISKLKRTILVAVAGSIGIIGVSAVLAVSHGVNQYIDNMQDDMLSSYPLQIAEQSVDYTSLITSMNGWDDKLNPFEFDISTEVGLESLINYLMNAYEDITKVKTNDINENLIKYVEGINPDDIYTISYNYGIDPTNNLFVNWTKDYKNPNEVDTISINGLIQRYISELRTVKGFAGYASYVDLFTGFMQELPDNKDFILSQYDMLGNSKYADEEDEMMIVVEPNSTMTDVLLAELGIFDHDDFINIARKALEQNKPEYASMTQAEKEAIDKKYDYPYRFKYEDLIGRELYYLPHDEIYMDNHISYLLLLILLASLKHILVYFVLKLFLQY